MSPISGHIGNGHDYRPHGCIIICKQYIVSQHIAIIQSINLPAKFEFSTVKHILDSDISNNTQETQQPKHLSL